WLNQRGFGQQGRVFNGFLWSMLTAYLLQRGHGQFKLAPGFSSYQLFKGTMDFIAQHDFTRQPIVMSQTPSMEGELQYEARLAMSCFRDAHRDTFAPLFLCHVDDPRVRHDYTIRIPLANINHPDVAVNAMDRVVRAERVARRITALLRQGLTNRVRLVTCSFDVLAPWRIGHEPAYVDRKQRSLFIGLLVDPDHVTRQVDKGPSPEDKPAAEAFRALWGDKAELRRFKDGSIVESVVWQNDDRRLIIRDMALYLIHRHLGMHITMTTMTTTTMKKKEEGEKEEMEEGAPCFVGTQLADMSSMSRRAVKALGLDAPALTFQPVMLAFNELTKQLRSLPDLPLDISAVLPAHPGLYYATLFPPQSRALAQWSRLPDTARYLEPIEAVVQFERSGAWPEDLVAVQHMKSAFYLKIRERLMSLGAGYRAVVGAAPCSKEIASMGYIDIYTPGGYVFRCRIEHTPEVYMLRRLMADKDAPSIKRDFYAQALSRYEHLYTHCPAHALQLQALGQRYPALSDTLRLVKRWFASHMLLGEHLTIADQAVELLCAAVFVDAAPWQPPGTGHTGFARVLRLLHTWPWRREPLVVDLEENITAEQREQIQQSFHETQAQRPQGMVIATGRDPAGSWWRANEIDPILVARIGQLAAASYACMEQAVAAGQLAELKRMFTPSMADYDVLLHLVPHSCPRYYERAHPAKAHLSTASAAETFKNLALSEADYNVEAIPAGFDPIAYYLADLQSHFGRLAYFFYDRHGGTTIGVVWRRSMLAAKPLRVNLDYSTRPGPTKQVVPNLSAIVAEMARLGQGIVARVEVQRALDGTMA
ncbi:Nrap protein, partial [Syncephalis pseudoplumigaleata]